jgi:hypothetical protein
VSADLEKRLATDTKRLTVLQGQLRSATRGLKFAPSTPEAVKLAAMKALLDRMSKMVATLTEIMKREHATAMSVIRNLK